MKIRFKKLEERATAPIKAHHGDAGWDLTATSYTIDNGIVTYHTSIAVAIPEGYFGLLCPRSSVYKYPLQLANGLGVIDNGYHGELIFKYRITSNDSDALWQLYGTGVRIGQLVILPLLETEMEEVHDFEETERGDGGFGSSGV